MAGEGLIRSLGLTDTNYSMVGWGRGLRFMREGVCVYIYIYKIMTDWFLYGRNQHNIVKQCSSN